MIARKHYPHLRENFFVEDIYNVEHLLDGEFDSVVANASLLHVLQREDLQFILKKIRGRLRAGGLLFVRLIHKLGHAPLDVDAPPLQDSITPAMRELLMGYVYRDEGKDLVDVNDLIPLYKSGDLSSTVFRRLLSKAQPLLEEIDGHERGENRWFVYFTPDELRDIALASGYNIIEEIKVRPHRSVCTVRWLSALLEKD